MSVLEGDSSGSLVSIARAVRARGLKGEIVADLLTDFPERFDAVENLIAVAPNGERQLVKLDGFWFQKDRVVLKLAGCDDVDTAREWSGYEFAVREAERVPLAKDEYYDWELEGCVVRDAAGEDLGRVRAIMKTGGVEILVVTADAGRDYLVPLADSIVIEIDPTAKAIVIDPPEGLLEL
jgi:16S rRNA processing protein RimM